MEWYNPATIVISISYRVIVCTQSRGRTGTGCPTGVWDQRVYRFRHLGLSECKGSNKKWKMKNEEWIFWILFCFSVFLVYLRRGKWRWGNEGWVMNSEKWIMKFKRYRNYCLFNRRENLALSGLHEHVAVILKTRMARFGLTSSCLCRNIPDVSRFLQRSRDVAENGPLLPPPS